MAVVPKDAAAIILLKDRSDPKVFWAKRNNRLMFMGGFHAFPGGQLDPGDTAVPVANAESPEHAAMLACAAREFFEETGVLLARSPEGANSDSLEEMRSSVAARHADFGRLLKASRRTLDAADMVPAGRWVTPAFAPRRFDTWFFLAWLQDGQEPVIIPGELESGEWIRPADALARWDRGEVIMAPPTLHILRTLAAKAATPDALPEALVSIPEARRGVVVRIESMPGIFLFPVRTPTLPPATHTNCYVVGGDELVVIDPASPYPEEQEALAAFIESLESEGRRVREIILTHHHPDHVSGVEPLRELTGVGVAAHRLTADRLRGSIHVDRLIEDNELIELRGEPQRRLRALHTPGHTRGHLCFYEENTASVITGDLVVGLGTVVIDPPEGNMLQYFGSLRRLLELPRLTSLFGAHGPAIGAARPKIEEYIEHRTMREDRILDALRAGAGTPTEIVALAYTDVAPAMHGLAQRSTLAHLEKLVEEGRVESNAGEYSLS